MATNVTRIFKQNIYENQNDKITETLSKYTENIVNRDKSVTYREIPTTYFLENDTWSIDFFSNISQFKEEIKLNKIPGKSILFSCSNDNLNKEIKFIVYNKIFSSEWSLKSTYTNVKSYLKKLFTFMNEKFPNINSFKELDLDKAIIIWINWLHDKGQQTVRVNEEKTKISGKNVIAKTSVANFLENIIKYFNRISDDKDEWEKDRWDVRNLVSYGLTYGKTRAHYYIDFNKINNLKIREDTKKYFKQRLISNNKFSWGRAQHYSFSLSQFINFLCELEPTWNDFNYLERHHVLKYIEWLHKYANENLTQKNSNPKRYVNENLLCVEKFLSDIQAREYTIAPSKNIRALIFSEDRPKVPKKSMEQIDYIPDNVLEQLFDNINSLHKDIIPIVYIMFKTGLRISDVLELKHDCLVKLNNKFWIETDIEKTFVIGHRIPIDNELANTIAVLIDNSNKYSNQDNNPDKYIFVRYTGSRKGKPYTQYWVQDKLNIFAVHQNIVDELGNRYHFKNHAFRHTYAIKLLNGGADILTVQELLAHASPEMTMRYAKLLDDTKRKIFDNAVKQGIFSFDESDKLKEENDGEIPSDIIEMLYTNHKLNAIDTPYGTCMQRSNGKCNYAKQPPCLTCNNGSPCKDLCVGAFEGDVIKYEILIKSTKNIIEIAKTYNRTEMIKENEEQLELYENIHSKISQGNMIFSRLDKLKKKVD